MKRRQRSSVYSRACLPLIAQWQATAVDHVTSLIQLTILGGLIAPIASAEFRFGVLKFLVNSQYSSDAASDNVPEIVWMLKISRHHVHAWCLY